MADCPDVGELQVEEWTPVSFGEVPVPPTGILDDLFDAKVDIVTPSLAAITEFEDSQDFKSDIVTPELTKP